jgi:RNA polymerase sigma factor (sigma-70 family)
LAQESDERLAAMAAAGDREAFAELVRRHRQPVYRACWSVTGNHADADDATQEAFLRTWRSLAGFDLARPFLPWLRRIARNAALDAIAGRRRPRTASLDEEGVPDPPDPAPDPEGLASLREEGEKVRQALLDMAPAMREAFLLRTAQALSYREIAEATGAPLGTVMSRLARARDILLARLDEGGAGRAGR